MINSLLKASRSTYIKAYFRTQKLSFWLSSIKPSIYTNMKGIRISEFGGPEVCKFHVDLPIPEPNDDQIQIKVHAAGVNPVDTYIRSGTHSIKPTLPYTPGKDSAGIVSKVGKNITKFKPGDRVFTVNTDSGACAEYAVCKSQFAFKLDENLTFEEGSALGVPYFTAYRALFSKANAKPGETVLIHGASGSVGIAAIQIAKAFGLKIIGTAGTIDGLKMIKYQGADYAFNHRDKDYIEKLSQEFVQFPNGIDIILEMLANVNLNNDMQLLSFKRGRIVVIGSRGNIEISPRLLMAKETSICGVMLFSATEEEFEQMNSHLQDLVQKNIVRPVLGQIYDLAHTAEAQAEVINNTGTLGRITIKI